MGLFRLYSGVTKKATKIIYGKYLVTDYETLIPSGALYVEGDTIVDIGPYGRITAEYRADELIGSSEHLVIPGLINAHSHGKGLTDFQRGQIDDTLETWKFRAYPPVDAGWDTLWNIIRHLECGVTTTMHNHNLMRPEKYAEEFEAVLRTYTRGPALEWLLPPP